MNAVGRVVFGDLGGEACCDTLGANACAAHRDGALFAGAAGVVARTRVHYPWRVVARPAVVRR